MQLTSTSANTATGFSQAFYREKLYESALGFKDLEDFMKNFWEAWALSKGMSSILEIYQAVTLITSANTTVVRSREHARNAVHLAERRRIPTRTLQWRL